ncbi:acyl-CoA dehydrogenase [Henriciella aquimarina]|uniref:acyl-CoA dehydrogenase n=1 Tax=Henriciella aquimarina TaxID=545261 RepID=UPI000A04FC41|nr:acyl-CoA dehydrogenase [Henriciella aquimarina]
MSNPFKSLRRTVLSKPLMGWYKSVLPGLSATEAQALEAGDTWWEADLFSGKPDWSRFRDFRSQGFTDEEQAFLDGPVVDFCNMLDDFEIEHERMDLPEEAWAYLKKHKFFGMIIPKEYEGLGFSASAHSEVVKRIATRNVSAAVTVMVPNSLGPGELLMLYGTDEQKKYYLPRLARGEEIPCFALTGVEAGSDASAMTATGVVCEGEWEGEKTLGIKLNWEKRYTTLGPVATLIGLAFKLEDPDGLLGGEEDLGITVALVPTDLPGVDTGDRHIPTGLAFQNGPSWGRDVFIPVGQILGGQEETGQGWKMLMGALAAGRGISLPSLSTAAAQVSAQSTGAYARVREQFGIHIGQFEGVQEKLAPIGAAAYQLESARRFITIGLDNGHHPGVASGIMKYHATERMRETVNHAMDVHGGKAICVGPKNYLETPYRAIPIGITVEGANILTRSLIIFGQGSIRCHPYILEEMQAVALEDKKEALRKFDDLLWRHVGHDVANIWRSWFHGLTGGKFASVPKDNALKPYYRELARYSANLAVASEVSLGILGGKLKFKESLSARLGDVLAELFLLSGALKRFEADGQPEADKPLLDWIFADGVARMHARLAEVGDNFPSSFWGWTIKMLTQTGGKRRRGPTDKMNKAVSELLMKPSETRQRLTEGVFPGKGADPLAALERALAMTLECEPLKKRMKDKDVESVEAAKEAGIITAEEAAKLGDLHRAVREVIEVDSFDPSRLEKTGLNPATDQPKEAKSA